MKHLLLFSIGFLCFFIGLNPNNRVNKSLENQQKKSTRTENVSILKKEFIIKGLNDIAHKVWVYLPPNYETSKQNFPVIYMHDAQNLFDNATSYIGEWNVDETLNAYYEKTGKGFIVVGIENGGAKRIEEYTPWTHQKYGGGKGGIYIDFLVKELKPFIDKAYKTKPEAKETAIIGSSLGGLISFYGGLKYPNVFGKIGALSTSFWFSEKVTDFALQHAKLKDTKLYLLVGGKEGEGMVPDTKNMEKLLLENGFPKENITSKIVAEAAHNEAFWRSEFLNVVTYLYN